MYRNSLDARRLRFTLASSVALVAIATPAGWAQDIRPAPPPRIRIDPKIHGPLKKPDVDRFIATFESDNREVYAKWIKILSLLHLMPGMDVADVGPGTGLFTRMIAEKVRPTGKANAVDFSSEFLAYIEGEARKRKHSQVVPILGSQDSTNPPEETLNLVFACVVYHHLEKPTKTLASIGRALRTDGRLVAVDFDRIDGRRTGFLWKHVRAGKSASEREVESAGFELNPILEPPTSKRTSS